MRAHALQMELDGLSHQLDCFLARFTCRYTTRQVGHVCAEARRSWLKKDEESHRFLL